MIRILIVDDEARMQELIQVCIQSNQYETITASSVDEGMELISKEKIDLVILDIMMPKKNGLEMLRDIRKQTPLLPVILLSALGETDQIVHGLKLGADDYVTKPFEPNELRARVQAVLRRFQEPVNTETTFDVHGLKVSKEKQTVFGNGRRVPLTKKEFQIFYRLATNQGRVFTREQLLSLEWEDLNERFDRNIDSHIKNIREKLDQIGIAKTVIETVWGVGYRMKEEVKGI